MGIAVLWNMDSEIICGLRTMRAGLMAVTRPLLRTNKGVGPRAPGEGNDT